jgi:hypothetical protein
MTGPRTIAEPIPISPEQAEKNRQYFERVRSGKRRETGGAYIRQFRQEMSYDEARAKFRLILEERTEQLEAQKPGFCWQFTDAHRLIWSNCLRYFINDPACIYPLQKGLYMCGKPGTGKTELVMMLERFTNENELSKAFKYTSMSSEYTRAKSEKEYDAVALNVQFDRCFDEVFLQTGAVKQFGNDIDLTQAIFETRYTRFSRYGQLTHIATNFRPDQAVAMVTNMLGDRFRAMFTSIEFPGESKR